MHEAAAETTNVAGRYFRPWLELTVLECTLKSCLRTQVLEDVAQDDQVVS